LERYFFVIFTTKYPVGDGQIVDFVFRWHIQRRPQ